MVIGIIRPLDCTSDTYRDLGWTKGHGWSIHHRDVDRVGATGYNVHNSRHFWMVPAEVRKVSGGIENQFCFTTEFLDVFGIENRFSIWIRHHMEKHGDMIGVNDRSRYQ